MRYRTIGKDPETRREVSVLSLGGMLFGTAISEPTSFAILDRSRWSPTRRCWPAVTSARTGR
jgi:aryl-alcohol dehydrogenase-like predicted oxidoreductase